MKKKSWQGVDRRQTQENGFKWMGVINLASWVIFVVAMILFHYARPEFYAGFYEYRGIQVREHWLMPLTDWLMLLLSVCVCLSAGLIWLKYKRARRKLDGIWLNVFFLFVATCVALISIFFSLPSGTT